MIPWVPLFSIAVRHCYRIQQLMISQLHIIILPANTLINIVVAVMLFFLQEDEFCVGGGGVVPAAGGEGGGAAHGARRVRS